SHYYRFVENGFESLDLSAVSIVIGCSSGRITRETITSEAYGSAYRFLSAGAPTYVGNLWDVTDKDIDTFSHYFFAQWLKRWKTEVGLEVTSVRLVPVSGKVTSLGEAISMSRDYCKLKHLIGAAPVVY